MKNLFIFLLALISCGISTAQEVHFFQGSWKEANDLAFKENKFIFVDAYTEWCGWCKVMDKEMFTDPVVSSFINENFVPVKVDFEDSLGILLSMKFRTWSYPTTLVFNPQGQLTGKFGGYTEDKNKYIDFLKANLAIKEERVFGFDSRELDLPYPEFYSKNFQKENRKRPSDSIVNGYLSEQQDLFSEISWSVIIRFHPRDYEDHVIDNFDKYTSLFGKEETEGFLNVIIYRELRIAVDSASQASLDRGLALCDKLEKPEEARIYFMMNYCREAKDWKGYCDALGSYIELNGYSNHMTINNSCWALYENADDSEILMKAVNWMKPVIEAEPVWMYLDTYAALLYKSGDLQEALKYADQAIEAGRKADEEDISSTEELRENIVKAMNGGE